MKSISKLARTVVSIASSVRQEMEAVIYGEYRLTPQQEKLYREYENIISKKYSTEQAVAK